MSDMLLDRLAQARRALRANLLLTGAGQLLAVLVAAVAAFFLVDWLAINRILAVGLGDTLLRALLLAAVLTVAGRVAWSTAIAEWRTRRSDDTMALRVERTHPALGGRLISAVQLGRALDESVDTVTSPELVVGFVAQTEELSEGLDFLAIIDRRTIKRVVLIAAGALLAAGILMAWRSDYALALVQRMALLPVDYPTATRIIAVRHAGQAAEGEPYAIEVEVDPRFHVPATAQARVKFANGRLVIVSLTKVADASEGRTLYRGQVAQTLDDFSFRPTAHDARWTRSERVATARRPALGELTVTCTYPAYLGLAPTTATHGDLRVPEGTEVAVRATVSKPLAKAALVVAPKNGAPLEQPIDIASDAISARFTVSANGTWTFAIEDKDGLGPAQPPVYTITVQPDKAPVVTVTSPVKDRPASPLGRWPLRYTVTDDHGLVAARLSYVVEGPGQTAPGSEPLPTVIDLPDLATPGELMVNKATEFDLGVLGVVPGQRVTWWIEVDDNRQPTPNIGSSKKLCFTIVDEAALRAEVDRQRRELQQRIERARDQQKEARDAGEALLKAVNGRK